MHGKKTPWKLLQEIKHKGQKASKKASEKVQKFEVGLFYAFYTPLSVFTYVYNSLTFDLSVIPEDNDRRLRKAFKRVGEYF